MPTSSYTGLLLRRPRCCRHRCMNHSRHDADARVCGYRWWRIGYWSLAEEPFLQQCTVHQKPARWAVLCQCSMGSVSSAVLHSTTLTPLGQSPASKLNGRAMCAEMAGSACSSEDSSCSWPGPGENQTTVITCSSTQALPELHNLLHCCMQLQLPSAINRESGAWGKHCCGRTVSQSSNSGQWGTLTNLEQLQGHRIAEAAQVQRV